MTITMCILVEGGANTAHGQMLSGLWLLYRVSEKSRTNGNILSKYIDPNMLSKILKNVIQWLRKCIEHKDEHVEHML